MTKSGSGSVLGDEWDAATPAQNRAIPKIEETTHFMPAFGADGTLPVVTTDADTGDVLMLAYMNKDALERTLQTGEAHYWSRSRGRLWKKGEESGNTQRVLEIRTDCDQDAIWLKVEMTGKKASCHTGRRTCFYRVVPIGDSESLSGTTLRFVDDERLFDPDETYGHMKAVREP